MDDLRFDTLARRLGQGTTRRGVFGVMAAGLAAVSLPVASKSDKHKAKQRGGVSPQGPCGNGSGKANRCRKDKECCTNYCHKGNCRCRKEGDACGDDVECCPSQTGRRCLQGSCQPASDCAANCGGCCDGETCVPFADQTDQQCGTAGRACGACPSGDSCQNGVCAPPCNPCPSVTPSARSARSATSPVGR